MGEKSTPFGRAFSNVISIGEKSMLSRCALFDRPKIDFVLMYFFHEISMDEKLKQLRRVYFECFERQNIVICFISLLISF